jgi:hypothetical protein
MMETDETAFTHIMAGAPEATGRRTALFLARPTGAGPWANSSIFHLQGLAETHPGSSRCGPLE